MQPSGVAVMNTFLMVGIACLTSFPALAACEAPPAPPTPPIGATASRDEMLAAQTAIKEYNVAVSAYAECAEKDGSSHELANANQAIHQLEKLAERFNAELRAFKQKNGAQ
jgi:hypothetical protein